VDDLGKGWVLAVDEFVRHVHGARIVHATSRKYIDHGIVVDAYIYFFSFFFGYTRIITASSSTFRVYSEPAHTLPHRSNIDTKK
jgi:hypothetical protein